MQNVRKILAPTDFSAPARVAVDRAVELAGRFGASVEVLHVCPLLVHALSPGTLPPDAPGFQAEIERTLQAQLDALVGELSGRGVEVHGRLLLGQPAQEIARVAEENGFDLVVMATHGRSGWARFTLGSVAEHALRLCHVPMLTLRADLTDGYSS